MFTWLLTPPVRTCAHQMMLSTSRHVGSAAEQKYNDLNSGMGCIRLVSETSATWYSQMMTLVTEIGRRVAEPFNAPRCTGFLSQLKSVTE